ncbi:IS21 family transposase [Corynebacterium sp. YIM 101645]|uniref:IS21 family transposase n=1 Tax=Corynebacterium lemuris TaxID=1859292 RepID=A0ABT2G0F3_9CORY|nr:IS21 family transposase [Corynebacterium lemuris]
MTDYRLILTLLLRGLSYRQIEASASCSHRAIARARKVLDAHQWSTEEQITALTRADLDTLFTDGRKVTSEDFLTPDFDAIVRARSRHKKPSLRHLWTRYLEQPAPGGLVHYSYDRFCELVAEHIATFDLTAVITHQPGHTMQVDWAGTTMATTDPITGTRRKAYVFVATLPYSGMVFACAQHDQKMLAWLDAHRQAFDYFGAVSQVIIPDNASTASNKITATGTARDVNPTYQQFLEHYGTAAAPTRSYKPKDKASVEAGVKIITGRIITTLADRVFVDLDELNTTIYDHVDQINNATPFRGRDTSRLDIFTADEKDLMIALPPTSWQQVTWRKSVVGRDFHIQIDTVKYSVPYRLAGTKVDVRITGTRLDVMADGDIVASHIIAAARHIYVTDPDHRPPFTGDIAGLWTRGYFLRQGAKIGPATVRALENLLDAKRIEAQGYRACRNILDLGKTATNAVILERACHQLTSTTSQRAISYTAVKNRMAIIRADDDQRPTTSTTGTHRPGEADRPTSRDTTGARLAGIDAFDLDRLLQPRTGDKEGQK